MWKENFDVTNFLLMILSIVASLYFLCCNYWIRRLLHFGASERTLLFISTISGSKNGFVNLLLSLCSYCHPLGKIWIGCGMHIVLSDPKSVEMLLKKHVSKGGLYHNYKRLSGTAMFIAPVNTWKKHRKLLNQTFNQNVLNSCLDSFNTHSEKVVKKLHSSSNVQIDINPEFFICFYEIVREFSMGSHVSNSLEEQKEFIVALQRSHTIVGKRIINPLFQYNFIWKLSGYAKEEKYLITKLVDLNIKMVKELEAKKVSSDTKTFLDLLLTLRDERSDEELVKELHTLFIAGSETSSNVSSFLMLMLAIHQDVQDKVYQEMFRIFGTSNREVTFKDLEEMKYLGQVINETLRLFPPAAAVARKVEEDIILDDHTFQKGTNFFIPIIFIHRNPINWPDPLKFDPDRFLPDEVAKRPRYAFMPFSIPPRNCIGLKLAEMSMKAVLSRVLRNFKVHTEQYDSVESINLTMNSLLTAQEGYKVTLVPRLQ